MAKWEFDFHPPIGANSMNVTCHCSECGCTEYMYSKHSMGKYKDVDILWGGFVTNYKGHEEQAKIFALHNALASMDITYNYCPNCGAKINKEG